MLILLEMITGNQMEIKCHICEQGEFDRNINDHHMWLKLWFTVPNEDE